MSPRLAALFVAAVLGLLTAVGLALTPLGAAVVAPYLVVVLVGLGLTVKCARGLRRGQLLKQQLERSKGITCSCCTSTVHDPVEVI